MYVYIHIIKTIRKAKKCGNTCHSLVCLVFEAPTVEGVPHSVRVSRNQGRVWYVFLLPAGIPHWPGVWTCIE